MAKSLDQRVKEAIGQQAWQILTLQTQLDEAREKIAALEKENAELKSKAASGA